MKRFKHWRPWSDEQPRSYADLVRIIERNRDFHAVDRLDYGDHGLDRAFTTIVAAIKDNKRVALYADYDVDGTMSCVSWIWFFQAIGFRNYTHYIPHRFTEGYGVNLAAVQHLATKEQAQVIITMDTGITANAEAAWCRAQGIEFICTDHHKIQPDRVPDGIILNPKMHPDPLYQELCGCGITFVLLRKLASVFSVPPDVWTDILALVGMATICDIVPLNGVNHKLAQQGVQALLRSRRPVLQGLLRAASVDDHVDEQDVGFRLGPRINAVGRLDHADKVIAAFLGNDPTPLIHFMGVCNEQRKTIQSKIVHEATEAALQHPDDPILFLGGQWHEGVVGIAASKLAERFWRPVWLFNRGEGVCKGSCRSIPGFDVTAAMMDFGSYFLKFGGHAAAGGFSFAPEREDELRCNLNTYAAAMRSAHPQMWESTAHYDCSIPPELADVALLQHIESLRPFGHRFEAPSFLLSTRVERVQYYNDKQTGHPKHTAVMVRLKNVPQKIMFFNEVLTDIRPQAESRFLVTAAKNVWQGELSLSLIGRDLEQ